MQEKGQIAIEYLALIVIMLIEIALVFAYSSFVAQESIRYERARNAASALSNAVNAVYGLGPGARLVIEIELPSGIQSQILVRNALGWRVGFESGISDIYGETDANIVGELPTTEGKHFVAVQMEESGVVRLGSRGLDIKPENIALTILPGQTRTKDMNATNNTAIALTGIASTITLPQQLPGVFTVSELSQSIAQSHTDAFRTSFAIQSNQAPGFYNGKLVVTSNEGYTDTSNIVLEIPHVLTAIRLLLFNDEFYSSHSQRFFPGQRVFHEIRFFDQRGERMDVRDLNVRVIDEDGSTIQTKLALSSSNGIYQDSYTLPCFAEDGLWGIRADANSHNRLSDVNSFTVAGLQQQSDFNFSWQSANLTPDRKRLENWTITNKNDCQSLTITKMKVTWQNDTDNAKLKKIRLNNQDVWSGTKTSGSEIVLSTAFSIPPLTSYSSRNTLEFDAVMNNNGETFQIQFTFSDNSSFLSSVFQS